MADNTTKTGSGYAPYAAGISTISNILSGAAATSAFKTQVTARADASIASMKLALTSYELEQMKIAEQIDGLNHVLGDKLTARGLQAIQNRAMLKTASAETGTVGGTTDIAVQEAFMAEHFDQANIIAESRNKEKALMTQMDLGTVRLQSDLDAMASGMPAMDSNPMLTAIHGGLNVFTETLGLMPTGEKVDLFGIKPTGEA